MSLLVWRISWHSLWFPHKLTSAFVVFRFDSVNVFVSANYVFRSFFFFFIVFIIFINFILWRTENGFNGLPLARFFDYEVSQLCSSNSAVGLANSGHSLSKLSGRTDSAMSKWISKWNDLIGDINQQHWVESTCNIKRKTKIGIIRVHCVRVCICVCENEGKYTEQQDSYGTKS